ncbi:MAG: M48 family metallopeptidase [candidate division Zixibacteria bacterium]|nr:M48 family metallopeptidase [candidate division Zixibacteria bacterium]
MKKLKLGNISIDVIQKNIKNIHLSVHPPTGRVRISAPLRLDLDTIRVYALSKLSWIKKQQEKFRSQEREAPREFLNKESHYFKGKRYLLKIVEENAIPKVILKHNVIELYVRPGADIGKRKNILDEWYREKIKESISLIITKWEKKLKVQVHEFRIKKMRTKWGTCNREAKRIWLNLELAKKPVECLEYIIVHEMVHLLERTHNERFISLMNKFMPKWKFYRDELNRLPVKHENWKY